MSMRWRKAYFAFALGWILAPSVYAAAPFYEGKTVKLIVGFSAGGGFDTYSRVIARHLGKHVPGNPTVVVENMTGAASLVAANHVYKVAQAGWFNIAQFPRQSGS